MRHLDTHTLWIQQAVRSRRVDLRKVRGEENPADLLTKHSSSRAKLEYLVSLFGCRYCDGRSAAAPLLRSGESSKVTLAQAAGDVRAVMSGNAEDICHVPQHDPATGNATLETARRTATVFRGTVEDAGEPSAGRETFPTLPHLDFSEEDLERLHPRILAPPEEPLHDLVQDEHDPVYQYGLGVAKELQEQADESGRKRHPEDTTGAVRPTSRRASIGPASAHPTSRKVSTGPARQLQRRFTGGSVGAGPAVPAARRRSAKEYPSQSLVAAMAPRASDH